MAVCTSGGTWACVPFSHINCNFLRAETGPFCLVSTIALTICGCTELSGYLSYRRNIKVIVIYLLILEWTQLIFKVSNSRSSARHKIAIQWIRWMNGRKEARNKPPRQAKLCSLLCPWAQQNWHIVGTYQAWQTATATILEEFFSQPVVSVSSF